MRNCKYLLEQISNLIHWKRLQIGGTHKVRQNTMQDIFGYSWTQLSALLWLSYMCLKMTSISTTQATLTSLEFSLGSQKFTRKESMIIYIELWVSVRSKYVKTQLLERQKKTWFRCAATQGRISNPDSPSAPPSGSTTATITGNVF